MKNLAFSTSNFSSELIVKKKGTTPSYFATLLDMFGLSDKYSTREWLEDFVDEDTGEVVSLERREYIFDEVISSVISTINLPHQNSKNSVCFIECGRVKFFFRYKVHVNSAIADGHEDVEKNPDLLEIFLLEKTEFDYKAVKSLLRNVPKSYFKAKDKGKLILEEILENYIEEKNNLLKNEDRNIKS